MPPDPEESAVVDFAVPLFTSLGYPNRPRAVRTREELPLFVCGEHKYAKPDICIIDRNSNDVILLVQEDRRFGGGISLHAQLIAEAIAAFQSDNARGRSVGLDQWDNKGCLQ